MNSLIESVGDYTRHCRALANTTMDWWTTESDYDVMLDDGVTVTIRMPDFVSDRSWRYIQDNGGVIAYHLDAMVQTLAHANDGGVSASAWVSM